jgi:hypothetical protein
MISLRRLLTKQGQSFKIKSQVDSSTMTRRWKVLIFGMVAGFSPFAQAETRLDHLSEIGYSSNLFEDPDALSGSFWQETLKLRGSLSGDDTKWSYAMGQTIKRTGAYRFGDTSASEFNLGYAHSLDKDTLIELEGAYLRTETGDVLLNLPQSVIGYETTDHALQAAARYTTQSFIGKTVISARASTLKKGDARFTISLLQPTKLDPDVSLASFSINHYVPALGSELCFCMEYQQSFIPSDEQKRFFRFPATMLRGSLAYARVVGPLTLVGEAGFSTIDSGHIPRESYPYLRAEAIWKLNAAVEAGLSYKRSLSIADIDDALGEDTDTYTATLAVRLTPWMTASMTYSLADSEYVYYIYNRERRTLAAKLSFGEENRPKVEIEYLNTVQRETDASADYRANSLVARLSGTF